MFQRGKNYSLKRCFAVILSVCLLFGLLPFNVSAWSRPGSGSDSGSTQTSVNHIDIGVDLTASVFINGEVQQAEFTISTEDAQYVTITAIPEDTNFTISGGVSTSTDNDGKKQIRIDGDFPVGTSSDPVSYTVTLSKVITTDSGYDIPVTLSTTTHYWDTGNVCPGFQTNPGRQSGIDLNLNNGIGSTNTKGTIQIQKTILGAELTTDKTFYFDLLDSTGNVYQDNIAVTVPSGNQTASIILSNVDFDSYTVIEETNEANIEGYILSSTDYSNNAPITLTSTNSNSIINVTNTYTNTPTTYSLTVNWIDEENNPLSSQLIETDLPEGSDYTTEQKTFEGYTFKGLAEGSAATSGIMDENKVVTYIYSKDLPPTSSWPDIPAKVYVLSPEKAVPADGANLGIGNYYPAADSNSRLYHYETNLPGELSDDVLAQLAASDGNNDLNIGDILLTSNNEGITLPSDWKDLWNRFELDENQYDITAYVIKVQPPNNYRGCGTDDWYGYDDYGQQADIHVDCYISNVPVNVTYHSNFSDNVTWSSSLVTGSHHTTSTYQNTQLPAREGYSFKGWATQTMGPATYSPNDTFLVVGNTDLYAVWEEVETPIPVSYTVTYEYTGNIPVNAPAVPESFEVVSGSDVTVAENPTLLGYTFSGWNCADVTIVNNSFSMPERNVIMTGTFSINTYKVFYQVDGEDYASTDVVYDTTITPITEPIKTGHTFSGWSIIPEKMPAENIVVTGSFTANKHNIIYLVDSEEYQREELAYGSVITPVLAPTKTGHAFSGWSTIPETMPDEDVIVEGAFTKCNYKITYLVDEILYKETGYDFDAEIVPEVEPTKTGHTFSGWDYIPEKMPAENITVQGTFTINKHDVIYMVDDTEYQREPLDYGTPITPIAEPTKTGYVFSGWSTFPEIMPDEDVIISGSFTVKRTSGTGGSSTLKPSEPEVEEPECYILSFETNGGTELENEEYEADTLVNLSKRPEKTGYIFEGWYQDEALTSNVTQVTMDKNITVYASWVVDNGIAGHGHPTPERLNGNDHFAYVIGFPDGTVRPDANMTRAEVSTIFFRLLKDDVRDGNLVSANEFSDVLNTDWYNSAISTLSKLGIINGRDENEFMPNSAITRAEFATICARLDNSDYHEAHGFTDITEHWAEEYILEAAAHGWIKGYEDGSFRPDSLITRAEVMTLVNRVLNRIPETVNDLHSDMTKWSDNNNVAAWYYIPIQEATNTNEFEKKNHIYKKWTNIGDVRDWTEYEK